MAKLFNRAKMTTSTTGSGTVTLSAAAGGFQSFADAGVSNGDVVQYLIEEGTAWEIGTGTYSSTGTSLTRTPSESSDGGTAITLAGAANVAITAVADDLNRLQHEGSTKVSVSATGASVTGALTTSGDLTVSGEVAADLSFGDSTKAKFGAGDDLQIYHDGSDSWITEGGSGTGSLKLRANNLLAYSNSDEPYFQAVTNGAFRIYYDGSTKLSTTSTGISVTGNATFADNGKAIFGAGSDLQIYHDGSNSYISDQGTGDLLVRGDTNFKVQNASGSHNKIIATGGGSVELYENNVKKFETTSTGINVTGNIAVSGNVDGVDVSAFKSTYDSHNHDDRYYTETESEARYLRKNAGTTYSGGVLTVKSADDVDITNTGQINGLQVKQDTANADALMTFHIGGDFAVHFGLDGNTNDLAVGGWSMGANKYKIWHAGNDGSGSGLDADTVDGIQASNFLRSNADDTTTGKLTVDNEFRIDNGDATATHFNYSNSATTLNYIRGHTTYVDTILDMNNNNIVDVEDMYLNDRIYHTGDTNTYIQFHAADQWRVVTGGSERLEVNGTAVLASVQIRSTGNITAYYSDERLKTKVSDIENPLDKVMSLEGFYYVENDVAKSHGYDNEEKQVALSAQAVQAVMPEVVYPAPFDIDVDENGQEYSKSGENYLTVDYAKMVPLLVEAIKEQQTQIDKLKAKLEV